MAATAEELSGQAQRLQAAVGFFKVDNGNGAGVRGPSIRREAPARPSVRGKKPVARVARSSKAEAKTSTGGIVLDMSPANGSNGSHVAQGSSDDHDQAFERY